MNFQTAIRQYPAEIVSVHDADTITARLDVGFGLWKKDKFRLLGIQAPEVTGPTKDRGLAARNRLLELVTSGPIFIQTIKDEQEKYGRYLAEVFVIESGILAVSINERLVKEGFAVKWDGKGKRPE